MWGDSKSEEWKKEEVARIKAEQGVATVEEPAVNMEAGEFIVNTGGENGKTDQG